MATKKKKTWAELARENGYYDANTSTSVASKKEQEAARIQQQRQSVVFNSNVNPNKRKQEEYDKISYKIANNMILKDNNENFKKDLQEKINYGVSQHVDPEPDLGTVNEVWLSKEIPKSIGKSTWNAAVQTGKGILDFSEGINEDLLELGSSRLNPFMWIAAGFDENKLEQMQDISKEIIAADASEATLDALGYNKKLNNFGDKTVQEFLDEGSFVKSDNYLGQSFRSFGAMLPSLMAANPDLGLEVMGASAYGSGLEEAYQHGATRMEANMYGILNRAIEMNTEGLGGMLSENPVTDNIKNTILNKITSGAGRMLFNVGFDMSGESGEELLGDLLTPIAQKLTYASEEDLKKLYEDQDFLNDFVVGGLTAGIMGTGSLAVQQTTKKALQKQINEDITGKNKIELKNQLLSMGIEETTATKMINEALAKKGLKLLEVDVKVNDGVATLNGVEIETDRIDEKITELNDLAPKISDPKALKKLNKVIDTLETMKQTLNEQQVQQTEKVNKTLDFYDTEMTQEEMENKVKEIDNLLENKNLSDELQEKLIDGKNALEEKINEFKTENQIEIQEEQKDNVKDTENEKQTEKVVQENEVKLEKLKSERSENETKIKNLEQELDTLRNQKVEEVDKQKLDGQISKQRRAIEQLEERIRNEKAQFGFVDESLSNQLEGAKNRLKDLQEQKKQPTQYVDNTQRINEIKKELEELKSKNYDEEINTLENEIKENQEIIKSSLDEDLSADEIGAEIEHDNAYGEDALEVPSDTVTVLDEMPKEEVKLREKIKENMNADKKLWRKFKSKLVNAWSYLEYLGRKTKNSKIVSAFNYVANSGSLAQYNIKHAQTDLYGNKVGKSIDTIFKKIKNNTPEGMSTKEYTNLFQTYMLARRQGTQEEGRAISLGKDTTRESALEIAKEIESEHPEFKEYQKEILKYEENLRKMMVDAGLITEETKELLEKLYPEYVKIERNRTGKGYSLTRDGQTVGINSPIKKSTGSSLDIIPLEETLANQTIDVVKACARNMFANELYKSLGGINSNIRKENIKNGIVTYNNGEASLIFYKDGVQKSIPIDTEIKELIAPKYEEEGNIQKALATVTRWQRNLITNLNPFFAITNVFRDAGDAVINSKHSALYLKNYPLAWKKMITNSTEWQQYKALGGLDTTYFDYHKGFRESSKVGKVVGAPVTAMEWLGNNLEQVTRFSEFLASLDAGESAIEAMYNANEVTVNFKKGGTVTKKASRYGWNYLNASILGTSKFFENIQNNKGKAFVKLATKAAFFSIAPAILNEFLLGKDKDYEELPDDVKNQNYIFKINGKLIKIPKGRLNSIISAPFRQLTSGDTMSLGEYGKFALDQIGPNNPLTSNAIYPLLQISKGFEGKNYFGNPIIPTRYKGKPLSEQYKDPGVTNTSKALSKWAKKTFGWNISPFQLDYLADQNLGFIWDTLEPNLTDEVDKQVWETKFVADSVKNNKYTNELFNSVNKYTNASTDDDSIRYKYYYSEMAKTWDYYKEIRTINANNDLSQKEKEKQTTKIRKEINKISKNAIESGKGKIKNKNRDGEKYKQLGTKLWKYNKKEKKWEAVRTNSREYKYMSEY